MISILVRELAYGSGRGRMNDLEMSFFCPSNGWRSKRCGREIFYRYTRNCSWIYFMIKIVLVAFQNCCGVDIEIYSCKILQPKNSQILKIDKPVERKVTFFNIFIKQEGLSFGSTFIPTDFIWNMSRVITWIVRNVANLRRENRKFEIICENRFTFD